MNSTKTKSNRHTMVSGKAIGGVVLRPEGGLFRIYVAWEWRDQALQGFFAVCKSSGLYSNASAEAINEAADYGTDITGTEEAKDLFHHIYNL